jgi:hypothetical protein
VTDDTALFDGVWKKGQTYPVWMSHREWLNATNLRVG